MLYVNIDGIDDRQLEFCGYRLSFEGSNHKLYGDTHGGEHIVSNSPPRYLFVEDVNDADCLRANTILNIQP